MGSFSPDHQFVNSIERGELSQIEEELYQALVPQNKSHAIDMEDFADLYGPDVVKKDRRALERLEKKFAEQNSQPGKFAEFFEALINNQIEDADLMGSGASVIVPSHYDDVMNGIDSIVEFKEEGKTSHLVLAIDATRSPASVKRKIAAEFESIVEGHLSKAKYFKSGTMRGELREVPRVVVGADHETVGKLSELLIRSMRMKQVIGDNRRLGDESEAARNLSREFSKLRAQMAEHPLHEIVLKEIKIQLEAFMARATALGKTGVAEHYSQILAVINEVIDEKGILTDNNEASGERKDEVLQMIEEALAEFGAAA